MPHNKNFASSSFTYFPYVELSAFGCKDHFWCLSYTQNLSFAFITQNPGSLLFKVKTKLCILCCVCIVTWGRSALENSTSNLADILNWIVNKLLSSSPANNVAGHCRVYIEKNKEGQERKSHTKALTRRWEKKVADESMSNYFGLVPTNKWTQKSLRIE